METVLERVEFGARVSVVRLRSLGDCVLTTPAVSLLKAHRPDLRIAVVVEDRFAPVFEGNADIETILPPEVAAAARWRPELCLNLHGGTRSMLLTGASRARFRAGFAHHRGASIYNVPIPRAQEILGEERTVHTAEHLASAMFYLGVPIREIPRARLIAGAPPLSGPYAVLHPFASTPDKTWPADRFLAVARHLRDELRLEPAFVAGPADDISPFRDCRIWRDAPLGDVKALVSGASLFVGNDSGPAHLAAAFGVPVVALFGSSNPAIWAPWRTEARVLTNPAGIHGIELRDVLEAVESHRVRA